MRATGEAIENEGVIGGVNTPAEAIGNGDENLTPLGGWGARVVGKLVAQAQVLGLEKKCADDQTHSPELRSKAGKW